MTFTARPASRPVSRVTFDVRLAYRQRVIAASYADGATLHVESLLSHSTRCGRPIGEGWTGEMGPAIPNAIPTCAGCVRSLMADPTVMREGYAACCNTTFVGTDPVAAHVEYHNDQHRRGRRSHVLGTDGLPNVDAVSEAHTLALSMNAHPAYARREPVLRIGGTYPRTLPTTAGLSASDRQTFHELGMLLTPNLWNV